ncbi:MAG: SDR family oxidoreductase [Spirochaetia bacterium]
MILVTGSTGNTGKSAASALQHRGAEFICGVRNPEKAGILQEQGIPIVEFDFLNPKTYGKALENVESFFLIRPPAISNVQRDLVPFLQTAKQAGVKRIVFLSVQGAEKNTVIPHAKIEKQIADMGFEYVFLRPSFFMQNLIHPHGPEIRQDDEIYVPAGDGKTNFIDAKDIGEAAAEILISGDYANEGIELTGTECFSYYEVADILSIELGRSIKYPKPGFFRFIFRKIKEGTKPGFALVMGLLYSAARLGKACNTTSDLEKILQRKPKGLREFIHEHREEWEKAV